MSKWDDDERSVKHTLTYSGSNLGYEDMARWMPNNARQARTIYKEIITELEQVKWNRYDEVEYVDYQYEAPKPSMVAEDEVPTSPGPTIDSTPTVVGPQNTKVTHDAEVNENADIMHNKNKFMYA